MAVVFGVAARESDKSGADTLSWKGPGHAVVQALKRIQWKAFNVVLWTAHRGVQLDLRKIGPRSLAIFIGEAVEAQQWRLVGRTPGLEALASGGFIEPLRRILHKNGMAWGPAQRSKLRLAVTGAVWDQHRLWKEGMVEEPWCRACKAHAGTTRHMVWACDAAARERRQWAEGICIDVPASEPEEHPLWSRGLMVTPFVNVPPPLGPGDGAAGVCISGPGAGWPLTGDVYTDASGRYGQYR